MTEGAQSSEVNETPRASEDSKDSLEQQPEVRKAAESMQRATGYPEDKVEAERDIKESEDLEAAIITALEVPTIAESTPGRRQEDLRDRSGTWIPTGI